MNPSEPKSLLELKVKKPSPAAAPGATTGERGNAVSPPETADTQAPGAAAAAGVLNAVDEDDEDGGEADVPMDFVYHSDGED